MTSSMPASLLSYRIYSGLSPVTAIMTIPYPWGFCYLIFCAASIPPITGMFTSIKIRSNFLEVFDFTASKASCPLLAVYKQLWRSAMDIFKAALRIILQASWLKASSSTIKIHLSKLGSRGWELTSSELHESYSKIVSSERYCSIYLPLLAAI